MEQFVVACCNMWERGAWDLHPYYFLGVKQFSAGGSFFASFNSLLHTQIGILACVMPQDVEGISTAFIGTSCGVLNV